MKYRVLVGRTALQSAYVDVEADSEDDAHSEALNSDDLEWDTDDTTDYTVLSCDQIENQESTAHKLP